MIYLKKSNLGRHCLLGNDNDFGMGKTNQVVVNVLRFSCLLKRHYAAFYSLPISTIAKKGLKNYIVVGA